MSKGSVKKSLELDFDDITIQLPDGNEIDFNISDHLLINSDLPSDVTKKMSECAAKYARWGSIKATMESYIDMLEDDLIDFERKSKEKAREKCQPKDTESKILEVAYLSNINEFKERKVKIRKAKKTDEIIKRIMRALEIQSEQVRSISASIRGERKLSESDDSISSETHGSFKNKGR